MAEYIEREILFEEIRKEFRPYWQIPCDYEDKVTQKMVTKMRGLIDKLPSADVVEVVHSKWVETYQPLGFDEVKCAECSSCGEDWIMDDDVCIDDYKAHWNCPCCGAKMDGKRKDSD